ncbi:hypothetical protein [Streptomyces gilvus]|uniref:hypothetical protein n=1 Tax=Streptomyces gilvus TaxID=2920937 RepID=UPI001F10B6F1|nr:hypothetical protein [Streptomyces sp. CME 23]MCH5677825.1 hypothetical protein [Streptomyces sp. CME 23]
MSALPPPVWADLFYDGVWNSITGDVSATTQTTATRGRSSERDSSGPAQGSLSLINTTGRYSRRNPLSSLYGKIGLNTPIRYGVQSGKPWMDTTAGGYASTPSLTTYNISTDLEVRCEFAADAISDSASDIVALAGRWGASGSFSWILSLIAGVPRLYWSTDGTATGQHTATGFAALPAHAGQRLALKVTFDVNDGAGGIVIRYYWAKTVDDPDDNWQLLGAPIASTAIGTQSVFNPASQQLTVGNVPAFSSTVDPFAGRVYRMQLRNGIGGSILADFDTSYGVAGNSSFTDGGSKVWTLQSGAVLSNRHTMLSGEIPSWTPTRDKSGNERRMPIGPAGILQRLGSGSKPLRSPLFRDLTSAARSNIVGYWPLEDGQNATLIAAGLPGLPAGTFSGALSFAADSSWLGSDPIPTFTTGQAAFTVPAYAATSEASVRFLLTIPTAGVSGDVRLLRMITTGTAAVWELYLQALGGDLRIKAWASDGTSLLDQSVSFDLNGTTSVIVVEQSVSGSTITWTMRAAQYSPGLTITDTIPGGSFSGTFSGTSIGRVSQMVLGGNGDLASCGMGHLALATSLAAYSATGNATMGWNGEGARARFLRLCDEEGVPGTCAISTDFQPLMGVQTSKEFLDLLREIETADMGLLGERPDGLELIYRGQSTLWNQAPVLVIDYNGGVISEITPKDDDRAPFNEMTAKRNGGSEYTYTLATGVNSVADIGRYGTSVDLSLSSDGPLASQAYRRVAIATVDQMRYPVIKFNLANPRTYLLFDQLMKIDHGDLIRLINVPGDFGPSQVDLLVYGNASTAGSDEWSLSLNCVPAAPWAAAVADATASRADTDGCVLAEALDATETGIDVTTQQYSALWVTSAAYPADFPFDVATGGEVMTVTACTGAVRDTFTRTTSNGWGTAEAGGTWTSSGGATSDYFTQGAEGVHALNSINTSRYSVIPAPSADVDLQSSICTSALATGGPHYVGLIARYADSSNSYYARLAFNTNQTITLVIQKRVAGGQTDLKAVTLPYTHAAFAFFTIRFQVIGSTLQAKAWPTGTAEPSGWPAVVTDTALTAAGSVGVRSILDSANTNTLPVNVSHADYYVLNPQTFTVTRGVNGISKSHPAGQAISLNSPVYAAM